MDASSELVATGWSQALRVPELPVDTPAESFELLRASALSISLVPGELRGPGCGLWDAASAQREIARQAPAVAIAFNMHVFSLGLLVEHWLHHRDTSWMLLEGLVDKQSLIASAFAEPNGEQSILSSASVARHVEGGVRITGHKGPCSLITTAELFCVSAKMQCSDDLVVCLVPSGAEGMTMKPGWDGLGMTDSDTGALVMSDVFVDRRLVFHQAPPGELDRLVVAAIVWFAVLITGTYHGVLTEVLRAAAAALNRKDPKLNRAESAVMRQHLGVAVNELLLLGSSARDLAMQWSQGSMPYAAALPLAAALRAGLSRARVRFVEAIIPLLGSESYAASKVAGRFLVDAAAVDHHPPRLDICHEIAARAAMGQAPEFRILEYLSSITKPSPSR